MPFIDPPDPRYRDPGTFLSFASEGRSCVLSIVPLNGWDVVPGCELRRVRFVVRGAALENVEQVTWPIEDDVFCTHIAVLEQSPSSDLFMRFRVANPTPISIRDGDRLSFLPGSIRFY